MHFEFELNDKHALFLVGLVAMISVIGIVSGYGTSVPTEFGHSLSELSAGTFSSGNYVFPNNLNVNGDFYGSGNAVVSGNLAIQKNLSVSGNVSIGGGTPAYNLDLGGGTIGNGLLGQNSCYWIASPWSCNWEIKCPAGYYVAGLKDTGGNCPREIYCCKL